MYRIASAAAHGEGVLPKQLTQATNDDVEQVLREAAAFLRHELVDVEHVSSVVSGAGVPCTDVVAYSDGIPVLVASPALYAD